MLIKAASELMQNQKHAEIMAPDKAFQVVQTMSGESLFFSVATDGVLYLTREISHTNTGWTDKLDLSSKLSANHGFEPVIAKSFAVSQNCKTMSFDIALVITAHEIDYLYISLGHTFSNDSEEQFFDWTLMPFDAQGHGSLKNLQIADVYLMNISSDSAKPPQNCFVDVLRDPEDPLQLLDRYYINPTEAPHWRAQLLSIDLKAGSISSCLGVGQLNSGSKTYKEPGIYTYGKIEQETELIYVPQDDIFDPTNKPPVSRLNLPDHSTVIASSLGTNGLTTLFVAATTGLWVFAADNQKDKATPVLAISASTSIAKDLFAGASEMFAATLGADTVVWCLNAQKDLFYVSCPTGHEGDPSAWSTPVPMCSGCENFAFYINNNGGNNVLFAHLSGQDLIRFTQIPSTGLWEQYQILLPTPDLDKMQEMNTFTSHVSIYEDDGGPATDQEFMLQSIGQTSAYINNTYYALDPAIPVKVSSGTDGTITVLQQTTSLSAVCFKVSSIDDSISVLVDPMSTAQQKLSTIGSGAELRETRIPTADGGETWLVPRSEDPDNSDAVASVLQNLLVVKDKLPHDGSPQVTPVTNPGTPAEFGIDYSSEKHVYREIMHTSDVSGTAPVSITNGDHVSTGPRFENGGLSYIKVKLGNLVKWMGDAFQKIKDIAIHTIDGFWHLVIKVAGDVWGAVLDCASAVADAIQFIFEKIKVAFEDLISWVGFLFAWNDIVRTHRVFKNILKQHAAALVSSLSTLDGPIKEAFEKVKGQIEVWANLTGPSTTVGETNSQSSDVKGSSDPQSHWGVYHTKNGTDSAEATANLPDDITDEIHNVLETLENLVKEEADAVNEAVTQIRKDIIDKISSLSAVEIMKRLAGIVGILLTSTAENIILTFLNLAKLLVQTVVDLLDAPLRIPVISPLYKKITGDQLSVLDLVCLTGAIPATIIYKIATGKVPFPDDAETNSLINAPDLPSIIDIMKGQSESSGQGNDIARLPNGEGYATSAKNVSVEARVIGSLNVASFFGSLVLGFCNVFKAKGKDSGKAEKPFVNCLIVTSYYLVLLPNISSFMVKDIYHGWASFNIAWTFMSAAKCFIDNLSPLRKTKAWSEAASQLVEAYIDVFWFIPIVETWKEAKANPDGGLKGSDTAKFVGGVVGNTGRTCAPLTLIPPATAKLVVASVLAVVTILAGGARLGAGILLFKGD